MCCFVCYFAFKTEKERRKEATGIKLKTRREEAKRLKKRGTCCFFVCSHRTHNILFYSTFLSKFTESRVDERERACLHVCVCVGSMLLLQFNCCSFSLFPPKLKRIFALLWHYWLDCCLFAFSIFTILLVLSFLVLLSCCRCRDDDYLHHIVRIQVLSDCNRGPTSRVKSTDLNESVEKKKV